MRTPQEDDVEVTLVVSGANLPALKEGVSVQRVWLEELGPNRYALGSFSAGMNFPNPVDRRSLDEVDDLFFGGGDEPVEQSEA